MSTTVSRVVVPFDRLERDSNGKRLKFANSARLLKSQFLGHCSFKDVAKRAPHPSTLHFRPVVESMICQQSVNGVQVPRSFRPAMFESSKLEVLFVGEGKDKHPDQLPRTYTLTHSDITAKLTLAVSQTINKAQIQGWYSRLQRDEVLAEWIKSQGFMSLHVHCHISGGHWFRDAIAKLRFFMFRNELPLVLEAFRYGDQNLFKQHPELEEALVWVYFHSSVKEFNRVECWGPLRNAAKEAWEEEESSSATAAAYNEQGTWRNKQWKRPVRCADPCDCCFPLLNAIPLPPTFNEREHENSSFPH